MSSEPDPVIEQVRAVFKASGKTLDDLGKGLGHEGELARKAAWQFLNKVGDPRVSTLRKFCQVMGIDLAELFAESKKGRKRIP
jgi:transcriptional regulator with XRE-family HTH domain